MNRVATVMGDGSLEVCMGKVHASGHIAGGVDLSE